MPHPTTWNLKKYFYDSIEDPQLKKDIESIMPLVDAFVEKFTGKLKEATPELLLEMYESYDQIDSVTSKIGSYLSFLQALNTQDTDVIKLLGELEFLSIQLSEKLLFINQEYKALGAEKILGLAEDSSLAGYKNDLIQTAYTLKYKLSEKEEAVLNIFSRPLSVTDSIESEIRGSLTFPFRGEELTEEEVRSKARDTDRDVRKEAYESTQGVYRSKQNQIIFGNTYSGVVKRSTASNQARGYETVMSKRNIVEQMDDVVVNKLMDKVSVSGDLINRYYTAKAKILGLENLEPYDTLAPIGELSETYTFEKGMELHLGAMKNFDPFFHEYSLDMWENGRIDVFPKKDKRGGAFSSDSPWRESFIFLNHTDTLNDVFTISHELGHATHGRLAQAQTPTLQGYPLCLAETASIFNELLLEKHVADTLSESEELYLLNEKLSDVFGTIHRQIMYVRFEREVHEAIASGQELTYKEFNQMWAQKTYEYSGGYFEKDPEGMVAWSMIPHIFHVPFYCYAYSFGMILSLSLMSMYEEQGEAFVPMYKEILSSGGSIPPKELLARYGIDITGDEFYDSAIAKIEELVVRFEARV